MGDDSIALVARINDVWRLYLVIIHLSMALLGYPFLLRLCGLQSVAVGLRRLAVAGFAWSCLDGRRAFALVAVACAGAIATVTIASSLVLISSSIDIECHIELSDSVGTNRSACSQSPAVSTIQCCPVTCCS